MPVARKPHHVAIQLAISAAFLFGAPALAKHYWPQLLEIFGSPRTLFVWGSWGLHMAQLVLSNLALAVCYAGGFACVEQYKIAKKCWPWQSEKAEIRALFWKTLCQAIGMVAFNQFVLVPPSAYIAYDMGRSFGAFSHDLESFPSPLTLIWQVAVCAMVEDTLFYWGHRLVSCSNTFCFSHSVGSFNHSSLCFQVLLCVLLFAHAPAPAACPFFIPLAFCSFTPSTW